MDKLDFDDLLPVFDLSRLSDVVKNGIVKKDVCKNIEYKISDFTNLAINTTLNAKINEVKNEIPRNY